jgi:adenine-specific DNA-methyltransferase
MMEKLTVQQGQSQDIVADNIARLKQLFPEILTENKIDFAVLKQLLGDEVEETEERYSFTWNGKGRARRLAQTPSTGTLRPCKEESKDWDTTQNLFIEGDNLEVLKLLQKSYHQKVKMIYIDPPYNTGKDFIYPDDFRDNIKNYLELTGQTDEQGKKLSANAETSGRYHTNWLNMMYPRLKLARNLLREDGVIFISIDESEFENLKALCNEVFGEDNFIASLIWEKGRKNDAKLISVGHEYMLVIAKSKAYFSEKKIKWREAKPGAKEILDEYLRLRNVHGSDNFAVEGGIREFYEALPKSHPSKKHTRYNKVDDKGIWRDDNISWPGGGGPDYDVIHPSTKQKCAIPDGGWRYGTLEKMEEMIKQGKVVFREDHTEPPIRKTYLVEVDYDLDENISEDDSDLSVEEDDLPIQVAGSYFYRSALQASNELNKFFGKKVFNNPKDREVIARWISYVDTKSEDIVMDFFAGSGTTAHSVLELNATEKKSIRYLLVQLPEPINPKAKGAKPAVNLLENLGKPQNIAELTKERLRRTGEKIQEQCGSSIDTGFRVFKLDSSNIKPWDADFDTLSDDLLTAGDVIKPERTADDVLFEILLKYGLDLTLPITTHTLAGKTVFEVGAGALLVCLEEGITEAVAEAIGQLKTTLAPAVCRVVFKDAGFADDAAKVNAVQVLKQFGIDDVKSL